MAFPAANHVSILEKTLLWQSEENLAIARKSYRHCAEIMRGYDGGCISILCPHVVGPFNYNWHGVLDEPEAKVSPFTPRQFDSHPIDFAWFMSGPSSAKVKRKEPVFGKKSDRLARSLEMWIEGDRLMDSITDEEKRMFKNYEAVEPGWK